MRSVKVESWVVYSRTLHGKQESINAVCVQSEWDDMERSNPGQQILVKRGIISEGEAERLARGVSGDPKVSKSIRRT